MFYATTQYWTQDLSHDNILSYHYITYLIGEDLRKI